MKQTSHLTYIMCLYIALSLCVVCVCVCISLGMNTHSVFVVFPD